MSFLTNLAKGFVRSTVNQVGRDTGKIISNKIYGDAHATPIKGVRHENGRYLNDLGNIITEHEFDITIREQGYKRTYFNNSLIIKLWGLFLGLSVTMIIHYYWGQYYALIPPILLVACGVGTIYSGKQSMTIISKQETPIFKTDLRYRDGRKITEYKEGNIMQEIPPTSGYIKAKRVIGVTYILLAVYMYASSLYIHSIEEPFSWHLFGKIILPAFAALILLHLVYRKQ